MLTRPTTLLMTFSLSAVATAAISACQQPRLICSSAHGDFAARYTHSGGSMDPACGQLTGDIVGMNTYFAEGGANGTPNYEDSTLAIVPQALGLMIDRAALSEIEPTNSDATKISQGKFSAGNPAEDDFCTAMDLGAAEISLPDIPEVPPDPEDPEDMGLPAEPATDVKYKWKDVRILVTADAQGTQFTAKLEYTRDGCTADYDVVGVYPAIPCMEDADCTADDSGLNPDFALECDTNIQPGYCMISKDPPSYEDEAS